MDLRWWSRHRRAGGEDGFAEWDFSTNRSSSFEEAHALLFGGVTGLAYAALSRSRA